MDQGKIYLKRQSLRIWRVEYCETKTLLSPSPCHTLSPSSLFHAQGLGVLYSTCQEEEGSSSIARNEEKEAAVQRLKLQSRSFTDQDSKRHRSLLEKKDLTWEEGFKVDPGGYCWIPMMQRNINFKKFYMHSTIENKFNN